MLVLTRRKEERIIIGEKEILIAVLDILPGQVRLGLEAPENVHIYREEIYWRIKKEEQNKLLQRGDTWQK